MELFKLFIRFLGASMLPIMVGLLFMGLGRIWRARIQQRVGPPFYQGYIDVIKCFSKTSITHNWIMDMGTIMALAGLIAASYFVPFASFVPAGSNGALFVILYLMPIGYLGMAMAVSASGNPNAPIGISRALALMLGYEIPFAVIILILVHLHGSTSLEVIAANQVGGFLNWNIIKLPFAFLAFEVILQAMMGEKPFDAMIAPSEIASGPMVELSGKYLGIGFLIWAVGIYVETALCVNIFLGGASNPVIFLLKQVAVYFVTISIHTVMPRYKIEQAIKKLWIYAGPLVILQYIITVIL